MINRKEQIRKVGRNLSKSHEFKELQKTEGYQRLEKTKVYIAAKVKSDFAMENYIHEKSLKKLESITQEVYDKNIEFLKTRSETLLNDTNTALYISAITAFIMQGFEREIIGPVVMPTLTLPLRGDQPITVPFQYPVPMAAEVANSGALGVNPAQQVVSAATAANPVVVTITGHTFNDGDFILFQDVEGMVELNGNTYRVSAAATNTVSLQNIYGTDTDGSGFTAYTANGTAKLNHGVGSADVTHKLYQGYPVRITHELMQVQDVSLLAHTIATTGDSLARRMDNLRFAAHRTATPSTNANRNYQALTEEDEFVDWQYLIGPNGRIEKMFNEFNVLHTRAIVACHPTIYYRLISDSSVSITQIEIKDSFGTPHIIQMLGNIQLIKSNHCVDASGNRELFIADPDKSGFAVHDDAGVIHTFPITLFLAHDIYGTMRQGATTVQPMSVDRTVENTA